jgi:hypothetical protein
MSVQRSVDRVGRDVFRFPNRMLGCTKLALIALGAMSCHIDLSSSSDGGSDPGRITLSLGAPSLAIWRGDAGGSANVTLAREQFDGPVTLSTSTTAKGLTMTLNPASLVGSAPSSALTVSAANDADVGQQVVFVTARGAGLDSQTVTLQLTVIPPQVVVTKAGTGAGTVTSAPSGIGCGNSCAVSSYVGASFTLTAAASAGSAFAGWSGACTGTAPTCTLTLAKANAAVIATFNSTAPEYSVAVTPSAVSVLQGGTATATVGITRVNGFSGPVNLAVSGLPAGLGVTANPASVTGNSATLNFTALASVAAGNYPLTVTATAAGLPQHSATFNVQVTPGAGGNSIAFSFASCDATQVPVWFAVQNGTGTWTRVTAGPNNTFAFPISATAGVAFVQHDGANFATTVLYASGDELTSIATGDPCGFTPQTGTKKVNGTFNNSGQAPMFSTVTIGGAGGDTTFPAQGGPNFSLFNVPAGARDLIAARHAVGNGFTGIQKMILRRSVNYSNNATMPLLDYGSAEAFVPPAFAILVGNLGADQASVNVSFMTANGTSAPFHSDMGGTFAGGPGARIFAIPDSLLQPGDFHQIEIEAQPQGTNVSSERLAMLILHSVNSTTVGPGTAPRTITFGAALASSTFSTPSSTPYPRPRVQLPSQSDYRGGVVVGFENAGANRMEIVTTAAYFNGTPATWTLDVPDLTAAGYDATWAIKNGAALDRFVFAFSGNLTVLAGAAPSDDALILGAAASSSSGSSSANSSALRRPRSLIVRRR